MAKLIEVDGWKIWISEVDGGRLHDRLPIQTPNMPIYSNYPEHLTPEQLAECGPVK